MTRGRLAQALCTIVLLLGGVVLAVAVSGRAADTTTVEASVEPPAEQSTAEPSTATVTVGGGITVTQPTQTVTTSKTIVVKPPTTTAEAESSSGGTPTWVWIAVGVAGVALVGLVVALVAGRKPKGLTPQERRQALERAASTWTAQDWAVEAQTDEMTVLQRFGERVVLTADSAGRITSASSSGSDRP